VAAENDVLDANEAADYLKINVQTVRRLARGGDIPAFRVGGTWRFRRTWLDKWAAAQRGESKPKCHVVAIDDEQIVLGFIERALGGENCVVSTASSGTEALKLMEQTPPDLVILDLVMPEMDGPETLGRIRKQCGAVPVIILTAYANGELMDRAMEHAPVTLIRKPPRLKQFLEAVRAVIGHPEAAEA